MTETTPTQQKITEITDAMRELLLYKNQKYGDSALHPKQIFYKGDAPLSSTSIAQRTVTDFNEDFYKSEED